MAESEAARPVVQNLKRRYEFSVNDLVSALRVRGRIEAITSNLATGKVWIETTEAVGG